MGGAWRVRIITPPFRGRSAKTLQGPIRVVVVYKAEPVGFEPTHPHGRRFSRPVQYQLCDGSKALLT
jgi:hypothetical protein